MINAIFAIISKFIKGAVHAFVTKVMEYHFDEINKNALLFHHLTKMVNCHRAETGGFALLSLKDKGTTLRKMTLLLYCRLAQTFVILFTICMF